MKSNNILKRLKHFFKRNAYAMAVSVCVILVLTMISITALTYYGDQGEEEKPSEPVTSTEVITFVSPIEGKEFSKGYAEDHLLEDKTSGFWQTHQALDYKAPEGTKVRAVYEGTVENVEHSMMDGTIITIKHSNNLKTVYKCLGEEALVSKGDTVKTGQEIGTVSSNLTEKADGPHLHFELYEKDKLVDPTAYFDQGGK